MSEICMEVDVEPEKSMPLEEEFPGEQVLEEFTASQFGVIELGEQENEEVVQTEEEYRRDLSDSSISVLSDRSGNFRVRDLDDDEPDSLIILINNDGTLSLDPNQLAKIWGPHNEAHSDMSEYGLDGNYPGVPVQLLRVSNDANCINLVVEGRCSFPDMLLNSVDTDIIKEDEQDEVQIISIQPSEKNKKREEVGILSTKESASTSDTGDHNAFIGMDRDQLLRLEKLLKSDEAKQILGENVTAMLDMLTSEEEVPPLTVAMTPLDAIRMDHNYTNLISPSPRAASPKNIQTPTSSTNQAPSTPSQSTVKTRSVGRPRKIPRPSPVLSEHLRKQRAQQIKPAHPGATLVPVITPLHIGLSKALKRASEGVGVKQVADSANLDSVPSDSDKTISAKEACVTGTLTGPSLAVQMSSEAETPVFDLPCASDSAVDSEEPTTTTKRKKSTYVPKKGKVVKPLKRKLVKTLKGSKKLKMPGLPKKVSVHAPKFSVSPSDQLLNDAMADALAAMESPPKSTTVETVVQKDPSPKTYGRPKTVQKVAEVKVDTPEVKEDSGSVTDNVVASAPEVEAVGMSIPIPMFKKHYPKRENRKPPAHLVDAFGPALFSTPDIIRRVSLESKVEDNRSVLVQRPPSPEVEKLPPTPIETQSPVLSSESVDIQPREMLPLTNGLEALCTGQLSAVKNPAVIVLMDEAISPSKSTALALNRAQNALGRVGIGGSLVGPCENTLVLEDNDDDIMDVSLCPLDSSETNATSFDESQSVIGGSSFIEQSMFSSDLNQSTSDPIVLQTDIPSARRKRQKATLGKKNRLSLTEPNRSEKKSKKRKLIAKDSLEPSTITLMIDSDDEGDIESDISWNSEDDPDRLWCICRKPHNNRFMICCDICNFWFHGKCVGITKAMGSAMELKEEDWTCPACVKKKKEMTIDNPKSTKSKKKQNKLLSVLVSGNASTSTSGVALPQTTSTDGVKATLSNKKKRVRNKKLVPAVEHLPSAQGQPRAAAMICVVCSMNEARVNSIYCSDTCILTHAQESGQPPTIKVVPPTTLKVARKAGSSKQVTSKGAPQKPSSVKVVPVKILPKKAPPKPGQTKPSLPKAAKSTSDAPKRGISRLGSGKKRPSGEGNPVLHASLDTSPVAEGSTDLKINVKAVHDSREVPKPRHLQLIDMKELPPLLPKPSASVKTPKSPTKLPQSPTKQLPIPPKVIKTPIAKVSELSAKSKSQTPSPLSNSSTPKGSVKKVDSKRQVSVDTPKKEEEKSSGPEPVRINVRKTLHELLLARIQECEDLKAIPDEKVKKITQKIEEELFAVFKDTGMRYKSKYRSLVFNIKDPKNLTLFRKIAEKSVTPYQLVRLTPEELASQELADWRERESKHQLEMIKKNEMDLLSLSKTYVMKTHKGEQLIESEGIVPAATVSEMEEREESRDSTSNTLDVLDTKHHVSGGKEKSKKHRSHRDKDKTRPHKRDKNKDKSKRGKSKHREKHRDGSKTDKSERKRRKGKNGKKSEAKVIPIMETQLDEKVTVVNKVEIKPDHVEIAKCVPSTDGIGVSPTKQESKELGVEPVIDEKMVSDLEPTSTVTIQIPDINSSDPNLCLTVWKGFMSMLEVSKFFATMQIVHGDPGDLFDNLPDLMNIVGRISPTTVWEYISKMKKSGTKDILIIRFTAANEEEQIPYFTLYSYLSGRSRLGVVGRVSKKIKDFYILPLSKHNPVPQVLLPLDGPGFEDNRPHLLLGIVVRSKPKHLSADGVHKAKVARKYASSSSPTDNSSSNRSYTPPLRDSLPNTSLDYESTPPGSPCESTLPLRLPDDGDEPYSPGGSDDDLRPVDVMGNPSNQLELERTMEELNRKIAEQKQQIRSISSAIGAPPEPPRQKNLSAEDAGQTTDGEEAYSPSSSFTPPRAVSPHTTSKDSATLPQISLPANLQEILANIKKQSDLKSDTIVHSFAARKDNNVATGKRELYVPTPVAAGSEATYVPSAINTTISSTSTLLSISSVSTGSPKSAVGSSTPPSLPSSQEQATSITSKHSSQKLALQDTGKAVGSSQESQSSVSTSFSSQVSIKSGSSSLTFASQSTDTSSPSDSSGVFQTIPLMLGAISPSALFPKSDKQSRDPRKDSSEHGKNRLSKYAKRGESFKSARVLGERSPVRPTLDDNQPPPPGVDTPPRPVPPPRCKSPPRPPLPAEAEFGQSFTCPPPNFQPVGGGYPLPMVPGPMPGVGYPISPAYYGPGYMPPLPMGNMMHPGPGHQGPGPLPMGFNPPYQEPPYQEPPYQEMCFPGPSGMYGDEGNQNRQSPYSQQRGSSRWKYNSKGKKRGRQEERGRDGHQRGNQSKEKSHRRDSRDKSRERSSHHKKSRNKSRSRDRSK